jgi:hypothetical protein
MPKSKKQAEIQKYRAKYNNVYPAELIKGPNGIAFKENDSEKANKEKLIFLFQTLLKEGIRHPFHSNVLVINEHKLKVAPFFDESNFTEQTFSELLQPVKDDLDFYRKYNMVNYKPDFRFNKEGFSSPEDIMLFFDFTYDFLKLYLKERLGAESRSITNKNRAVIEKIEVLEDKTELKKITLYINGDYNNPAEFKREQYSILFYNLARDNEVPYERGFFNYFNSNRANPLYKKYGFTLSKIFKQDSVYIEPNIPITLKTQKFISQTKNKTS